MSKVERIELYHVARPFVEPFYPSWIPGYPQTVNRFTLIKLITDDGIEGYAAGNAFASEREGLGSLLGGFLIGVEAGDIKTVRERLREASYLGWRNWWLEQAFWDLKGKQEGKPVYKLLQDKKKNILKAKVYASTGSLKDFRARKPYLDEIRSMGITSVKIRVHKADMNENLQILKDCRKELGDDFSIGVDANQGWPVSLIERTPIWSLEDATEFGKGCDDLGIDWLEEPLDMHDWDGMAELRKRIKTPISGGELQGDWHEVRPVFEHECLDKYQPDCTFCGGLTVSKMIMDECRKRGLKFSPHTWTNGLGLMANLHAFGAWGGEGRIEFPYETPGFVPEEREAIIPPVLVNSDGTIDLPQEPGIGYNIEPAKLRKYARRFHVTTPFRLAVRTIREKGFKTAMEIKKKKEGKV